jgi:hypothetical protein
VSHSAFASVSSLVELVSRGQLRANSPRLLGPRLPLPALRLLPLTRSIFPFLLPYVRALRGPPYSR